MEDRQIVELYWERSEAAIAETEQKYGRYCYAIARQILFDDEDAKEVVNDTWLRAWNTIPPKRPDCLKPYVGTISRNLALDVYDAKHAEKRGGQVPGVLAELSECVTEDTGSADPVDSVALRDALNTFLAFLPWKTRIIFVRRYYYTDSVAGLAAAWGMKPNAVAALLLRTRRKLKKYLESEGF